jgi:Asp/Glu/hydantoin racemase
VLHIDSPFVFVPGNLQNATTLRFPVAYECVEGLTPQEVLTGSVKLESALVVSARRLEAKGVRAVVGACGSFANCQAALTRALSIPVFSSVLTQVPWLLASLPHAGRLAIVFADKRSFTDRVRAECGITDTRRLVITDCMGLEPFTAMLRHPYTLEHRKLEAALVEQVAQLVEADPQISMIMLQCSELPPYAAALQKVVDRPIVDVVTLTEWAFAVSVRSPYRGYL